MSIGKVSYPARRTQKDFADDLDPGAHFLFFPECARSWYSPSFPSTFLISHESREAGMKTNFLRTIFGIVFVLLMCVSITQAQSVTGAVTGTVTDPSDAAVVGAHVVVHNLDTGVDSPTKTNSTGDRKSVV